MTTPARIDRRFCIAPMLDWSDRHCRYFWRQLTDHAVLYTEMITTGTLLHADPARFLAFDSREHPLALQLGGSNPKELAHCAQLAERWGYDEINLNCGCPSDRVQSGSFGACLMAKPLVVADCIKAMQDHCEIPVTVKHRLGIDDQDSYEDMLRFIEPVAAAGCNTFIVHARKAWLQGLSPKQNRELPPLRYEYVYQLKRDFPELEIILNGGIRSLDDCDKHLRYVDGVMLGRAAYENPYLLAEVDQRLYQSPHRAISREQVLEQLFPYIEQQLRQGTRLNQMTRHLLGLYQGVPGARAFRRHLSENAHRPNAGLDVLHYARQMVINEQQRMTDSTQALSQ